MLLFTEQFSNDSCKTNTKVITATNQNSAINQSEFVAITHNLLRSQEKSCTQGATGFDFACHWFNLNWHKIFKPITKCGNCIIVLLLSTVIWKLL